MKRLTFRAAAALLFSIVLGISSVFASEFYRPWHSKNSSIVLDAYEYTPLKWEKMKKNKRLAGFINKASDGLSPSAACIKRSKLCRVTWRRYVAARELYHTRKVLAKTLGMKWGAYHLARPGNPIRQAEHFLSFAKPKKDELVALDIEHNDPKKWMSLKDAERFARHIKRRIGRYPVLYTNHSTAKFIAANRGKYKLLSRLNLWYARYKPSISGAFPMGNWDSYTVWQFSSMVNCSNRSCPWRIKGAGNWIDVNVVNMPVAQLKKEWPFAELRAKARPLPKPKVKPETKPDDNLLLVKNEEPRGIPVIQSALTLIAPVELPVRKPKILPWYKKGPGLPMAVEGRVGVPKWRPGASIVKRIPFRTSDEIISSLQAREKQSVIAPEHFVVPIVLPPANLAIQASVNSHAPELSGNI